MTPSEATVLARYIRAHFPQQPIDEFTAEALSELLAPYPANDCKEAVLHIAKSGEHWCSPSDVMAQVKRVRAKRIAEAGDLCPPPGLTEPQQRAWLGEARRQVADGQPLVVDMGELKPRHLPDLRELLPAPDETKRQELDLRAEAASNLDSARSAVADIDLWAAHAEGA